MAKLKNVAETAKRKRIINAKECEYELRESLEKLLMLFGMLYVIMKKR